MMLPILLLLLTTAFTCQASSQSVLVLLDDPKIRSTHSMYFNDLISRGHEISFKSASDKKLQLKDWDEWLYDKIVIFAPTATGVGANSDHTTLLEFIDAGKDVLIAVESSASELMRSLAADVGFDLDAKGALMTDHVGYVKSAMVDHTLIASEEFVQSSAILGNFTDRAPILFKGAAATISPESTLGISILGAPDTAFSHLPGKPVTENPLVASGYASLVAAVQARSGARVVLAGSVDMFSNAYFTTAGFETASGIKFGKAGNRVFCDEVTKWAFHERGVLRVTNMHHSHAGKQEQPDWYRVNDDLEFGLDISELVGGVWQPFKADDVQVEFVMLDPYVRTKLQHNDQGHFYTAFKVPDVYGVYKFVINYHRAGYTPLELAKTVSVRPFRHDEFERFLVAAYPYYMSVFSTMAAFFVFGFAFLYHK